MSTGIQHNIDPIILNTYKLTGEVQLSKKADLTCDCGNSRCAALYLAVSDAGHDDLWLGTTCAVKLNVRFRKGTVLATGVRLSEASNRPLSLATQLSYVKGHARLERDSAERRAANALKEEARRVQAEALRTVVRDYDAREAEALRGTRASISKLPGTLSPG
jgi:hypothetical protein